jgi:multidrug resistance efflux pump
VTALAALVGMAWGGYAIWFALTHVRTSYARVTGLVVNVAAKTDARVQQVLVRTGDEVAQGQLVALLDKADLEAQAEQARAVLEARESELARAESDLELTIRQAAATVAEAEAQLAAAHARLAQAEAEKQKQTQQQPDEVRRAEANLASAESQLKDAEATLRRTEKLFGEGAISELALDAARTEHQVAQAAVESAKADLAVAKTQAYDTDIRQQQIATRSAEERQARAGLASARTEERAVMLKEEEVLARRAAVAEAKAAVDVAETRLSDAALRSQISGVVVKGPGYSVKDGEVVEKGVPIVTLVSTEVPLWINASISELYVDRVREGQPVLIRMEAFRRRWFHGEVEKVGRATEFAGDQSSPWMVQQVPLKLTFDPKGRQVKHGMSCRVWVDTRKR